MYKSTQHRREGGREERKSDSHRGRAGKNLPRRSLLAPEAFNISNTGLAMDDVNVIADMQISDSSNSSK